MLWYVGRRLLQMIPVFIGATFLIYAMVFLLPGDPIAALAGDKALSPAVAAQLRARYHLDQPFLMQYFLYLKGIFTLDFGTSFSGRPVSEVLAQAFPITIKLSLMHSRSRGSSGSASACSPGSARAASSTAPSSSSAW